MGRKRLSPEFKRVGVHITLSKKHVDYLKKNKVGISKLIEKLLKNYLNMK
jgi:hypothetical protein